jgi:PhnB protein
MARKAAKRKKKASQAKNLKLVKKKKTAKKTAVKGKKKVLSIPKGYHTATPCLTINQASDAIDFYKQAFTAKEIMRFEQPDGKIAYAEIKIGDTKIMLGDEQPEMGAHGPKKWGSPGIAGKLINYWPQ